MTWKEILKIIGEILILIGENLSVSAAIKKVSSKHNVSEDEIWSIWRKYG
ncbi:MAG: hypothetical protein AB9883_06555 [Acidaminococcaceae bacterium]